MISRASEISDEPDTFFTDQLNNNDVIEGFVALGDEILQQLDKDVDAICDTIGTAGTLMGIAKSFKNVGSNCKIVALEPASSPILSKGIKGAHNVEGVGLGFIPALYNPDYVHNAIAIEESTARKTCRDLAISEGIFCGTSGGMNVAGAIKLALRMSPKENIVTFGCDSGLKYL